MNDRLPCRWIAGCWQIHMDINRFLAEHYTEEELDRIFAPPKEKVQTLVDLIEKARKAKEEPTQ